MPNSSSPSSSAGVGEYFYYSFLLPGPVSGSAELTVPGYRCAIWRPALWRVLPSALVPLRQNSDSPLRLRHYLFFWIYHYLSVFGVSREYQFLFVFHGEDL